MHYTDSMLYVINFSRLREITVHTILHSVAELYIASQNEESGHELLLQYLRCWLLEL
jgi:hypothetical protein